MLSFMKKLWRGRNRIFPFSFDKPLVMIQSDDWGRVGVRDKEGYEQLRQSGIPLGESAYDHYSLETAEDVMAVRDLLLRHRDFSKRPACMVMNFVMANLDFSRTAQAGFKIHVMPLSQGFPGAWRRPGLFDAYQQGVADRTFFPALHGLTHFNTLAVENALAENGERKHLLKTMWAAETPYIFWRMPWVGYEYLNPEGQEAGFLPLAVQSKLITEAAKIFKDLFSLPPLSVCAPGYRANLDTRQAWAQSRIRVVQVRSEENLPPFIDEFGILELSRTIDFEPAHGEAAVAAAVQQAEQSFSRGIPAIISIHSINFHSSLRDFRGPTLQALDEFLSTLEARHPDLLYVHDQDIYKLITEGKLDDNTRFRVKVRKMEDAVGPSAVLEI